MKKMVILLLATFLGVTNTFAQFKKDGTPDMRYKANRDLFNNSYSYPNSNLTNPDVRYQNGYIKDNGTYVLPHYKTQSNETNWDNFSTKDNTNPYNGLEGYKARDYSEDALNYGLGEIIYTGPKGGQYYYNSKGEKVYVPKR